MKLKKYLSFLLAIDMISSLLMVKLILFNDITSLVSVY